MDDERRAAWKAAISLRDQGKDVPNEDHYALLREGMFKGVSKADAAEEAYLFLQYWVHSLNRSPLLWLGEAIGHHWFHLCDWDRQWGSNRADKALREYVAATDFDHWTALNTIAARLHRERKPFPDVLADWSAEFHEGKHKPPRKERGHKGLPPYVHEGRNAAFFMADNWLEHFGMTCAEDRLTAISGFTRDGEDVIRKGLARWQDNRWRRAPWPEG